MPIYFLICSSIKAVKQNLTRVCNTIFTLRILAVIDTHPMNGHSIERLSLKSMKSTLEDPCIIEERLISWAAPHGGIQTNSLRDLASFVVFLRALRSGHDLSSHPQLPLLCMPILNYLRDKVNDSEVCRAFMIEYEI